jgi:hypothetical protein
MHAEPSIYPTGVTRYDPHKAYNMFVLFGAADYKTHLIDMDGKEIHRWEYTGFPSGMLDPKLTGGKRGHVIVQLTHLSRGDARFISGMPVLFSDKTIGEVDWNGKTVWEWGATAPGGAARQNHDWSRLANGNTLVLSFVNRALPGFTLPILVDDVIYEVTPRGEIVWRWAAGDHLDEFGFTREELALVRHVQAPLYLGFNNMKVIGPNHWFREGDQRFDPNNIIIDSREANFTVIIDKKTGHIVWRLGPDYPPRPPLLARGRPIPTEIDQISGQHDAHIIPDGLPGAGNLLVFDNQGEAGYPPATLSLRAGSRVLEIDPVKRQIVWEYTGTSSGREPWTFYSSFISDARRLPNGNTFIDEGMNGRFFQVTRAGEIVWEYVSPYFGPLFGNSLSNWVYRAQPVPYDWVPAGTSHGERAVVPPDVSTFRVPGAP